MDDIVPGSGIADLLRCAWPGASSRDKEDFAVVLS